MSNLIVRCRLVRIVIVISVPSYRLCFTGATSFRHNASTTVFEQKRNTTEIRKKPSLNILTFETRRLTINMLKHLHHLLPIYSKQFTSLLENIHVDRRNVKLIHPSVSKGNEIEHVTGVPPSRCAFWGNWYGFDKLSGIVR